MGLKHNSVYTDTGARISMDIADAKIVGLKP